MSNDDHRSTAATSKLPRCSRMAGHVRVSMLLPVTSRFGQVGLHQQPEPTVNHHAHMRPRHLFHGTRPETCLSNRLTVTSNGYHSNGWSPDLSHSMRDTLDHQRTELGSSKTIWQRIRCSPQKVNHIKGPPLYMCVDIWTRCTHLQIHPLTSTKSLHILAR